jgi:hypothetical protein
MSSLYDVLARHRSKGVASLSSKEDWVFDRDKLLQSLRKMEKEWAARIRLFQALFILLMCVAVASAWFLRGSHELLASLIGGDGLASFAVLQRINDLSDRRTKVRHILYLCEHASDETLQSVIDTVADNFSDF